MSGLLVLVTGTGRSGTSTMSGTLHHLGLSVPGPYLGANPSNPKGFFESSWAVSFHKRIERRAGIQDFDGRPEAIELARAAVTQADRERLRGWLAEQCALDGGSDQIVVKDPRSVWAQRLWKEVAAELDLSIRYVAMVRHPAEVVGSRAAYYASEADAQRRRHYEVASVARWVNSSLVTERETRGEPRAFVSYPELLTDWRAVMGRVGRLLDLTYGVDLDGAAPHPVDDFIDPDLRRVRVGWDDLDVPPGLRQMAQELWERLMALSTVEGQDAEVAGEMNRLSGAYASLYLDSRAICNDAVDAAGRAPSGPGRSQAAKKGARPRDARPESPEDRRVRDVTTRQLVHVVGRRVRRRIVRPRG